MGFSAMLYSSTILLRFFFFPDYLESFKTGGRFELLLDDPNQLNLVGCGAMEIATIARDSFGILVGFGQILEELISTPR